MPIRVPVQIEAPHGTKRAAGSYGPFLRVGVMDKAEEYRRYAAECLRIAKRMQGHAEKASLLQMAETWRRLAERAEVRASNETT